MNCSSKYQCAHFTIGTEDIVYLYLRVHVLYSTTNPFLMLDSDPITVGQLLDGVQESYNDAGTHPQHGTISTKRRLGHSVDQHLGVFNVYIK